MSSPIPESQSDSPSGQRNLAIFGGLVVLTVGIILSSYYLRGDDRPTPQELASAALANTTRTDQTAAAVRLGTYGEPAAKVELRRVLRETTVPDVKAACIEGLGKVWDYESMDLLLDAVEFGSPKVRGRAAVVITRMTGRDRRYRAKAPAAERQRLVRFMCEDWEEIRNSPYFEDLKQRLREGHERN